MCDPQLITGDEAIDSCIVEGGVHRLLRWEVPHDGVVVPRGQGGHVTIQVGQPVVSPWYYAQSKLIGHIHMNSC